MHEQIQGLIRDERDICALPGCDRNRQYEHGSGLDYCCKYCFIHAEGRSPPPARHESWCDRDEAKRQARLAASQGGQPPSGHKTPHNGNDEQGRQSLFGNMTPKAAQAIAAALQARTRTARDAHQGDGADAVNRVSPIEVATYKYVNYDTGANVSCVPGDNASVTSTMTPPSANASGKGGSSDSSRSADGPPHPALMEALYAAAVQAPCSFDSRASDYGGVSVGCDGS